MRKAGVAVSANSGRRTSKKHLGKPRRIAGQSFPNPEGREDLPEGVDEETARAMREYIKEQEEQALGSDAMRDPDLAPRKAVAYLAASGESVFQKMEQMASSGELDQRAIRVAHDRAQYARSVGDAETAQTMTALANAIASSVGRQRESASMRLARRLLKSLSDGSLQWEDARDELHLAFSRGTQRAEQQAAAHLHIAGEPHAQAPSQRTGSRAGEEVCTREEFVNELQQLLDESEQYAPSDDDLQQLDAADRESVIARRQSAMRQVADLIATAEDISDVL